MNEINERKRDTYRVPRSHANGPWAVVEWVVSVEEFSPGEWLVSCMPVMQDAGRYDLSERLFRGSTRYQAENAAREWMKKNGGTPSE